MGRLDGRVAVITGSTRGIGRAIAERCARDGARVVVNGRNGEAAAAVAQALCEQGHAAVAAVGDVAAEGGARAIVSAAFEAFGRLDIMVNNAGIARVAKVVDT